MRADVEDLVVELHAAGPGEDHVHLFGLAVLVRERLALVRLHAQVPHAALREADLLPGEPRLLQLSDAVLRRGIRDVLQVHLGVVAH